MLSDKAAQQKNLAYHEASGHGVAEMENDGQFFFLSGEIYYFPGK